MASVSDLVVASAEVKSGKLYIRNRRAFDDQIARLDERWELEVTVKRQRATRSQQQNRYYWGVVVHLLSEHTGYTPDEMHEFLKMKFIPKTLAVCDGNGVIVDEFVIGGSTREMNTIQFGEYVEEIKQWAAQELDVVIPDPDEDAPVVHDRVDPSSRPKWYRANRESKWHRAHRREVTSGI
jgi:hypothetical protein